MSYRHLIRLLDEHRAQWLAQDRAGRVLAGPTEGFPATQAEETVVLVPSADVLLLTAPRVARQRHQLERAIPFAIEEHLVTPVEKAHVVILDDAGTDTVDVAVVAREQLQTWLARLQEHGVVADRLLPEGLLLPFDPAATLLLEEAMASLRYAATGLLSGTQEEVTDWLSLLDQQNDERPLQVLAGSGIAGLPAELSGLSAEIIDTPSWLAARVAALPVRGVNLLTGPFAPERRGITGGRAWAWAASLLIAGFGLAATTMALERWQLDRQHAEQRAQMELLLREALPDIQRVVDPRAQLLGELSRRAGQGQGGGALAIIARVAPLLSGSGRYTLDALEYRGGTLDITLRSPDVATLDELRERITTLGYATELASMVPGSSGVEGKLRIRGGGA